MMNMIMKNRLLTLAGLALTVSAFTVAAQPAPDTPPPGGGSPTSAPGGPRPFPPRSPIIAALDANHDGVIDAQEIANAPAALKTLDKNNDGQLTRDEYMPPPGGPRRGGPPGAGRGARGRGFGGLPEGTPADGARPAQLPPGPPIVAALDANHDGVIDAQEIANAPAALKILDKNNDGQLTPDEWRPPWAGPRGGRGRGMMGPPPGGTNAPPAQAFRPPPSPLIGALDANHDGVIDAQEIAHASETLKTLDKNNDGQLTPDEFLPPPQGPRGGRGGAPGAGGFGRGFRGGAPGGPDGQQDMGPGSPPRGDEPPQDLPDFRPDAPTPRASSGEPTPPFNG